MEHFHGLRLYQQRALLTTIDSFIAAAESKYDDQLRPVPDNFRPTVAR